jgi:hippurate hydrolase
MGTALEEALRKIIIGIGNSFGCEVELSFDGYYPATVNAPNQAKMCADVMASLVGEENVNRNPVPSMGAEDFAFMLEKKQGSYAWLGTAIDADDPKLHNPDYDFNDDALPMGAAYWVALVEHRLSKEQVSKSTT